MEDLFMLLCLSCDLFLFSDLIYDSGLLARSVGDK